MPMVRVYNENVHPYNETFKGTKIHIPAKGNANNWVEMDEDEANLFLGSFSPPIIDADGGHDPRGYKMLKIVGETGWAKKQSEWTCQACKYEASNEKDLNEHIDAKHLDSLLDKDLADERRKKAK